MSKIIKKQQRYTCGFVMVGSINRLFFYSNKQINKICHETGDLQDIDLKADRKHIKQ